MALKTKKPNFTSANASEQLALIISYIDELTSEIEFKFDTLSSAVERLRQMNANSERSDAK